MLQRTSRISVIVLTANRPRLLNRCLTSIEHQTVKPYEILIVDASKDHHETTLTVGTWENTLPLRVMINTKRSIPYGRTIGARNAKGNLVVYIDDDLSLKPRALARIQHHFKANPGLSAVMGKITNALPENPYASTHLAYYDRGIREYFPSIHHPYPLMKGMMFDVEISGFRTPVISTFGFNTDIYRNEDVDLGIRLAEKGKRMLFDPSIVAEAVPRTTLLQLWNVAFFNGFYNAYIGARHMIRISPGPHRIPFPAWLIRTLQSKTTYPVAKKIWFGFVLISFPIITRIGGLWYSFTHLV